MAVKPRKRMHNVKEEDITNPEPTSGMCSTKKSSAVIIAEANARDEKSAEAETVQSPSDGDTTNAFTEGDSNVEETINIKPDTDEPNGTGTDIKNDSEGSEVGSPGAKVIVEKTKEEKRREEFSKTKIEEIDKGARAILSCLEPQFAHEFELACTEYKCAGIGIYLLAILNRLSKEADYYNPDFEPEWEQGDVGFREELRCQYCNKIIVNPTRMKQKYCSNLCAKYDKERNETGLIFPEDTVEDNTVEEAEEQAFNDEKKRLGEK